MRVLLRFLKKLEHIFLYAGLLTYIVVFVVVTFNNLPVDRKPTDLVNTVACYVCLTIFGIISGIILFALTAGLIEVGKKIVRWFKKRWRDAKEEIAKEDGAVRHAAPYTVANPEPARPTSDDAYFHLLEMMETSKIQSNRNQENENIFVEAEKLLKKEASKVADSLNETSGVSRYKIAIESKEKEQKQS